MISDLLWNHFQFTIKCNLFFQLYHLINIIFITFNIIYFILYLHRRSHFHLIVLDICFDYQTSITIYLIENVSNNHL